MRKASKKRRATGRTVTSKTVARVGVRDIGARAAVRDELAALAAKREQDIDTSDIPEIRNWRGAEMGKFYRPVKKSVTIRLDADVLAWFKARGGKYQTTLNRALREYILSRR